MKTRTELHSLITTDINTNSDGKITAAKVRNILDETVDSYVHKDDKDATGGVPGLTLFKINFKNVANTFTSFFTNSNTAARTYIFKDRNGTIADDTDLNAKNETLVSGTNIKTVNGTSLLGSGDITVGVASGIWGIANSSGVYTYYATYPLVHTASVAGQCIELFGDVTISTESTLPLKNGVNINGNGHTVTLTGTTTDGFVGTGVICDISNINIVKVAAGMNAVKVSTNSVITGNARISNTVNGGYGLYAAYSSKASGFFLSGSYPLILYSYCFAQNITITSCSYGPGMDIETNSYALNCSINSTSTTGGGALYVRDLSLAIGITVIANGSIGAYAFDGGIIGNSYIKSLTNNGCLTTGVASIYNSVVEASGGYGVNASGGGILIDNTISSSSHEALYIGGGYPVRKATLRSSAAACVLTTAQPQYLYECYLLNTYNNANGHGIVGLVTGTEAIGCTFELTHASAYALYSASTPTVGYSNNKLIGSTNMASATIVQGQTNTADAVGNIIIN